MERNPETGYLSLLRLNRAQVVQLVVLGLVLGVGANLLASYVAGQAGKVATLVSGLVAIGFAGLVLLGRVFRPKPRLRHFEGFFVYDARRNGLVEQDSEYGLGHHIAEYLAAAFAEDSSTRAVWDRNPLATHGSIGENTERRKSLDLIRQAAEYFVLGSFSVRLSDHFRSGDFDPNQLDTLLHTDLPDVLLQNRFMKIFSEPMEDRAPFRPEDVMPSEVGTIHVASGEGGALYERFELVLPTGWKVARSAKGEIEIVTRRFKLTVSTACEGWSAVLPPNYLSKYLGLGSEVDQEGLRYAAISVGVSVRIEARAAWLVTARGWRYYRWIDEWIADLEPEISQDAYFERIGYAEAATVVRLIGNRIGAESELGSEGESDRALARLPERDVWGIPVFAKGDAVEHASFGPGVVIDLEPDRIVVVRFDRDGAIRKLLGGAAPLRLALPKEDGSEGGPPETDG